MSEKAPTGTSRKALDLWVPPAGAGEPLVCVATSFTFDATFFETECLGRFLQMDTHPTESDAVGYLIEREEKLAASKVCVLIDRRHARDKESMRWDVIGVLVPRAIQHAKLALLVWGNHARVIIGSGNLTEPGYRQNLEIFGTIEFSRNAGGDREALEDTLSFLERVARYAVGRDGNNTPKDRLREALSTVRRRISHWPASGTNSLDGKPLFGEPESSALEQMREEWPSNRPPRWARVVSPFFDRPGTGAETQTVAKLVKALAERGDRAIEFYVRTESLPDGRVRVYAPKKMIDVAMGTCNVAVYGVSHVQNDEPRFLHAKMLGLFNDEWRVLLVGSSNFTGAGLGSSRQMNFEANLLYRARESPSIGSEFDRLWPRIDDRELDPNSKRLVWDPEPETMEGLGSETPLPACFQEVLFAPGLDPRLLITLGAELPVSWIIRTLNGETLLSAAGGVGEGEHSIPWMGKETPFLLEVAWQSPDQDCMSSWPVNVRNPSELPAPECLKDLSLEELLEILASSRPLSEATVRVLNRRSHARKRIDVELDPLKRLDSPTFLLRRTKRVAAALDRLRERLERPALTRDAFEWRLFGPVGPRALAEAFVREARIEGEAKFYLAELTLALQRVSPQLVADGGISVQQVTELLGRMISELKNRAMPVSKAADSTMLDAYVSAVFARGGT